MTKFLISNELLLKNIFVTYDKAVKTDKYPSKTWNDGKNCMKGGRIDA